MSATEAVAAPLGSRVGAALVDGVLGLVLGLLVIRSFGGSSVVALVALLVLVGGLWSYLSWLGSAGSTPGKRLFGVRVQDVASADSIGLPRAALRQLVLVALGPVNLVQLLTVRRSSLLQGWHDRLVGSVVVVEPAVSPAPAPKSRGFRPTGPPLPKPVLAAGMVPPPPGVLGRSTPAPPSRAHRVEDSVSAVSAPPVIETPTVIAPIVLQASAPPSSPVPLSDVLEPPGHSGPVRHWELVAFNGAFHALEGTVVIGRAPNTEFVPGGVGWAVRDAGFTVSKTHAAVGIDQAGPWIEDLDSTNGVRVRRETGTLVVQPRSRTVLHAGDQIELGDFVMTLKGIV